MTPTESNEPRKMLLTRTAESKADAIKRTAHALGQTVSDFLEEAALEKLSRSAGAVSLANRETESEIARLSNLATSITAEATGRRGSDV